MMPVLICTLSVPCKLPPTNFPSVARSAWKMVCPFEPLRQTVGLWFLGLCYRVWRLAPSVVLLFHREWE